MNLSKDFTLEEAAFSSTAVRLGIDNTPAADVVENMKLQAIGMERVRELLRSAIHVDSWFRCEALERVITHGDYLSWCARHDRTVNEASWAEYFARKAHPKGLATDFLCALFGPPSLIVQTIQRSDLAFDELIQEGDWVHCSFAPAARRIVLTAHFGPHGDSYTVGAQA